jgi:hypothetical protein
MRLTRTDIRVLVLLGTIAILAALVIAPRMQATSSSSERPSGALNPNKIASQTITWVGTDASELLRIPHAESWGCPDAWLCIWGEAAPYADAETCYIVKSEFSVGQTFGTTTIVRDEGITTNATSGATCEMFWFWQ